MSETHGKSEEAAKIPSCDKKRHPWDNYNLNPPQSLALFNIDKEKAISRKKNSVHIPENTISMVNYGGEIMLCVYF